MSEDRTRRAAHEAGHALVSWLLGYRFRASLEITEESDGHCDTLSRHPLPPADELLIFLAGPVASEHAGDEAPWIQEDTVVASKLAAQVNPEDPYRAFADGVDQVRALLRYPRLRQAHEALVRALQTRGTLGGAEAEALMVGALARRPGRSARSARCQNDNRHTSTSEPTGDR